MAFIVYCHCLQYCWGLNLIATWSMLLLLDNPTYSFQVSAEVGHGALAWGVRIAKHTHRQSQTKRKRIKGRIRDYVRSTGSFFARFIRVLQRVCVCVMGKNNKLRASSASVRNVQVASSTWRARSVQHCTAPCNCTPVAHAWSVHVGRCRARPPAPYMFRSVFFFQGRCPLTPSVHVLTPSDSHKWCGQGPGSSYKTPYSRNKIVIDFAVDHEKHFC